MEYAITVAKRWGREQSADTDSEVIARIANGDRQALDALYQRYAQPLFGYLLTLTADHGLAEEIMQDTFVAAWRAAENFEGRSSVKTWLFGIARRQSYNSQRRRRLTVTNDAMLDLTASDEPEPETVLLQNAARQTISDAIAQLRPVHREVLVLAFVHGYSYAEMAELLDVPIGTIRSRLSNARRLLRQRLEPTETER